MLVFFHTFFIHNYTLCIVLLGMTMLGITSGILGTFALLRKQSLLGDAISHASLPGIALMFLLTHSNNPSLLMIGGTIAAIISFLLLLFIQRTTHLKTDTALGVILSVFFGFGLVLTSYAQKYTIAHQAVLNSIIFGNAATLLPSDIIYICTVSVFLIALVLILWKEFKLLAFDQTFLHTSGYSTTLLTILLTLLLVINIVVGLQAVGIILMSALLIAPAAAARQWTNKLSTMALLASFFGAFSCVVGTIISSYHAHVPTGPVITIIATACVALSCIITPNRGKAHV